MSIAAANNGSSKRIVLEGVHGMLPIVFALVLPISTTTQILGPWAKALVFRQDLCISHVVELSAAGLWVLGLASSGLRIDN